ncbi:endopolyphosphatase [Flammula alnicola]|nr:endopolyphosphatase [Flammula alnicola]
MLWSSSLFLLVAGFVIDDVVSSPVQVPFGVEPLKPRKLRGRFLHITDIHPDPHYTPRTSQSTACHRKKPKKKKNGALYYGTPYSECDSPFHLTNHTLDFINEHWANEIDFVIWTGDNARHDNDRQLPRTPSEINGLNRAVAAKMQKVFTSKGIPVVPSLGNNDVWPHNIMTPGPNSITNEFASIWSPFIPFPYLQVFQRGAYYTVEVIPDEVAVISLNTMYFYDSNKVVSGCSYKEPNDPGNLQIDWMEVQLEMYRNRGMQVWIAGHVPPSSENYFSECYVRYVELALRFQDTILGHLYGHMNVDHFFFLEAGDLGIFPDLEPEKNHGDEPKSLNQGGFFQTLLGEFMTLPKSPKLTDYAVVNVAPSVVPNPYTPSFRIFSYNVTGANGNLSQDMQKKKKKKPKRRHGHHPVGGGNKTASCEEPEYRDTWRCHLDQPWYSDSSSPSRKNQRWTPLGYAQYYIPNLDKANKSYAPQFELEYLTYALDSLHPAGTKEDAQKEFAYPVPVRHLPESLREPGVVKSKYAPYRMDDLTIPSWIRLARQLADGKRRKLRKRFRKYMFLGGEEE